MTHGVAVMGVNLPVDFDCWATRHTVRFGGPVSDPPASRTGRATRSRAATVPPGEDLGHRAAAAERASRASHFPLPALARAATSPGDIT